MGLYEKTIHDTIDYFDEECLFLAGFWNNLGAVYICMRQNERMKEIYKDVTYLYANER